jgi:hypothetical protein
MSTLLNNLYATNTKINVLREQITNIKVEDAYKDSDHVLNYYKQYAVALEEKCAILDAIRLKVKNIFLINIGHFKKNTPNYNDIQSMLR